MVDFPEPEGAEKIINLPAILVNLIIIRLVPVP